MTPGIRFLAASAGGIFLLKSIGLASRGRPRGAGLLAFLFAWPGVIPGAFRRRRTALPIEPAPFLAAWTRMAAGAAAIVAMAVCAPYLSDEVLGLAGVAAILCAVHLGACAVLPWLLRWAGFDVPPLFDRPWAARSLAEFWGRRWNLAFVEMNQRVFLRPVRRLFGRRGTRFALFALSGLLHEMALSFPAAGGWGLPMGYFLLQGVLVEIETRFRIANRAWTWICIAAPAPLLFHEAFRRAIILPFYWRLHSLIAQNGFEWYLSYALYAAVLGHLAVLIASVQVPARLGWKDDIAKLSRFNQKIFWLYGLYILLCIVSFAALTWRLHDDLLRGVPAARCLAAFIAVFWTGRVAADVFWYDSRDWPRGNAMVAGHALLTSLFGSLACVYWVVAARA